jgi:gliding-associated putative ABC transporter substrate-binding component GldG
MDRVISKERKTKPNNDLIALAGAIVILILINIIGQKWFFRLDLTTEKRYSLSRQTKEILKGLNDVVTIRVYLEGDLNIPFKKFQDNIRDILDEFRIYGRSMIQYEFVNPYEDVPANMQNRIIEQLNNQGLKPTNIHQRDKEGGVKEKIIFPGAMIMYRNIEVPLNLLANNPGLSAESNLNNSVEGLEYAFISTIKNITSQDTEKIAFLEGHGELSENEVHDISVELSNSYQIDRGSINGMPGVLDPYKAVIIAKPQKPFPEPDKFVLDQYIMKGGKVLWLIDVVQVSLDSMTHGETLAFISDLNLDDMFFKYGVRINPELVQDIQCNIIPVNVALSGNQPNFQPAPWLYYPLITPNPNLPVCRNLNLVLCRFANPIDTISARKNIKKTVLLSTSDYSRTKKVPALISLEEIQNIPSKDEFNSSGLILGVLLEGEFESVFTNRGIDAYFKNRPKVISKSKPTRMAVIADGDLIRNEVSNSPYNPSYFPLGYDRYTRQTFGNKEFLLNVIQYLADDNNLIGLRGREFKLRLLQKEKITSQRNKWIWLNMLVPPFAVILFGLLFMSYRKHHYSK